MLKWLVIGIGDITRKRVIPAILSESRSKLTGFVTRDPSKAELYGVPAWTDLDAALRESGCDAVYVASPVALHAAQTIAALRAGCDVLCEKPMAMTYAEAEAMVAAERETGMTLGIAYYRRMYPAANRAKELIEAGAIGKPVFAEATAHDWFLPTDDFRAWLIDPKLSGAGPLFDIAVHRLDLMHYLFGDATKSTGQISNAVNKTAVEDNATVLMEHPSGVRSMVDVRWHSRIVRDEFRIRGTDGEMSLTPLNSGRLVYPGGEELLPPHANLHYPCVENFASAVLNGEPLRASGASSLPTARVIERVLRD
ncbi:MAG: Gfo/Idh/MocA family oxidoreductase [Bryobacteraceae bacterium]|nr:Gfo/Idh/MocA family oxidoreductase [Bryobacteraceae bacterium]